MRARTDYAGKKVGKLTGICVVGKTDCEAGRLIWKMRCECLEIVYKTTAQIRSGKGLICQDCKLLTLKNPRQSKFFKGQLRPYNKRK